MLDAVQKIIDKINFEEKWLKRLDFEEGRIKSVDLSIAMDAIRHTVVEELEGKHK